MLRVDWGSVSPSDGDRALVESRLEKFLWYPNLVLALRAADQGYEARIQLTQWSDAPGVRLTDSSLHGAVERMVHLHTIVARESGGLAP